MSINKSVLLPVLGIVAGLLLVAAFTLLQPYRMRGSAIDPPQPAPDINLGDFHLSEQRGKAVLLFFGYTYCPDVCPATLGEVKQVMKGLQNRADKVQPVFITVDPKRDTPERIALYADAFDANILGVSGNFTDLEPVWQAYGVYRAEQPGKSEDMYLVDHSARVYLIDPQGNLRATYPFGSQVENILADVKFVLK